VPAGCNRNIVSRCESDAFNDCCRLETVKQVSRNHRARARLSRTLRIVQDGAALLRFKLPQLPCGEMPPLIEVRSAKARGASIT
jgi:hypothetical protein